MLVSIIYTVLLLLLSSYAIWFIAKRKQKRGEPPIVPFWIPWLGSGLTYQKDPISFLKKQTKKYGPIFTVFMGGNYFTFVTDPFTHPLVAKEGKILNFRICTLPMIKHLFDYQRPAVEEPTMGGLFVKYLQGQRLNVMIEKMMKCLQRIMLAGKYTNTDWSEVGLLHFVESIMCTASFSTLFGDYPKSSNKDIPAFEHQMFEDFRKFDEAFPYLVKGYPLNSFKGLEESRKNFWKHLASDELNKREMVSDLIAEYARICNAEKDSTLPKKLFSTAWAAQSNTMVSAFWTIYFVTKHGDAKAAAEVEIQRLLKETSQTLDGKTPINFNRDDMDKMTVLDSIINESLRLHVSASMLRQALQDYDLKVLSVGKTYRLRKGDRVMSLFELNHKDPEIYSDPDVFKYDRFLNEDGSLKTDFYKNGKVVRFALQPFGSGLSKCPGRYWAVTELKQIVILLLLYFDFELINPNEEIKMNKNRVAFGSLPPTNDPKIRFRRRVMT